MTVKLLPPDVRRILDDLARRIGILERRRSGVDIPVGHSHDGTGTDSTITHPSTDALAVASGARSISMGEEAAARGLGSVAVGWAAISEGTESVALGSAYAYNDYDIAIGQGAESAAQGGVAIGRLSFTNESDAVAIGASARATYAYSTAVGRGANTSAENQIMLGDDASGVRIVQGCPDGAIPDAAIGNSQMSFYLNEAGNLLTVKVKYASGTVKTGTIALT